jgi:hypothetical protein
MPNDDTVPERLIAALRDFVPPELEAAIIRRATANLTRRRKRVVMPWVAAAAALVIAAFIMLTPTSKAREDVNRDGRVDIRDALLLARKISSGNASAADWDFNHDGRVDQDDTAIVAAQAVRLNKRGAS